jgi:hypothetical protein
MTTGHLPTQFDLAIVERAFRDFANLQVLDRPQIPGRRAVVLFSSNGLYFPNTEAEATRVLVEQDRFEWRRTLPRGCRRVILVRDVFKTWYLRGINPSLPNPTALAERLRHELQGWDVQMGGVSSGGFAAVLFGRLVGARRVFSLAGQFSLQPVLDDQNGRALNPLVAAAASDPALRPFLEPLRLPHQPFPEIIYVVPRHSVVDAPQRELAEADPRIQTLAVDSDQHDVNLLRPALRRLFERPSSYLDALAHRTPPGGWHPVELSRRLSGNRSHFSYLLRKRRDLLLR